MSIDVNNLSFHYNSSNPSQEIPLRNISLSIDKSELVLICGKIGSGKSTLVQHFNGLLTPRSGTVTVDGMQARDRRVRRRVGMLFQFPQQQLFGKTVFEDVAFGPRNFGIKGHELEKRVHSAMSLLGLSEGLCAKSPFDLSEGQKRLVAIAGVLASGPQYLVLDEPLTGLDTIGKEALLSALQILRSEGTAIIVVSHQTEQLLSQVDRVFVLDEGKLVFTGTSSEYVANGSYPLPEITCLMKELKSRGFDVKEEVFHIEEAFCEIVKAMEEKCRKEYKARTNVRLEENEGSSL